ncbi:Trehalose utilization [Planctomycetales bacterium 10988]|nr:Trehalose utilization [Planctomycetales bacterium 10988]
MKAIYMFTRSQLITLASCFLILMATFPNFSHCGEVGVTYSPSQEKANGKKIVLISGDEEYRSEEALPQLGKILTIHHGFECTVLFSIDPETGLINPNISDNIPGLEALKDADLMIIFTRYRALPGKQMKLIDNYLKSGKPVLGIRTATHAFFYPQPHEWWHYSNGYQGEKKAWEGGFGRLVLGEQWISHHGHHRHQSARGVIAPNAKQHPISRGIQSGDIWGPSDVYTVRLPLPGDSKPIILGQVIDREREYDANDPLYGMRDTDTTLATSNPRRPDLEDPNDPLMPIAWTKSYKIPGGKKGRVFTSTIGAATDMLNDGTRRLLVNGVYWCLKMEDQIPSTGSEVSLVGEYEPSAFQFQKAPNYWTDREMTLEEHQLPATSIKE